MMIIEAATLTAETTATSLAERVYPDVDLVLQDYEDRTDSAVMKNLEDWQQRKAPLLDLLRRHPDWSEEHLAVIQDVKMDAKIGIYDVNRAFDELRAAITDNTDSDWIGSETQSVLDQLLMCPTSHLDAVLAHRFETAGVRAKAGQVTSRALHKLLEQEGFDITHGLAAKRFADLANILRPNMVPHRFVLSIHPCDYLLMSNFKHDYSCKRIMAPSITGNHGYESEGEYCAGVLEYMVDASTAISYLYDQTDVDEPWLERKLYRSLVLWDSECSFYQARLYPFDDNTVKAMMRRATESIFAMALDEPDYWETCAKTAHKNSSHMYFDDYCNACQVVVKGRRANTIRAGEEGYCIDDGYPLVHKGSLRSTLSFCCYSCNEWFDRDDMRETDDEHYICDHCYDEYYFTCEMCNSVYHSDSLNTTASDSYICNHCYDGFYFTCEHCDEIYHQDFRNATIDNTLVCDNCKDEHYVICSHCEGLAHIDDTALANDETSVCITCLDDYNARLEEEGAEDEVA